MTEENTYSAKNFQGYDDLNLIVMISLLEDFLNSTKVSDDVYEYYIFDETGTRVIKYNDITLRFHINKHPKSYEELPGTDTDYDIYVISQDNFEELGVPIIEVENLKSYARSYEKIHLIEIMKVIKKLKYYGVEDKEIVEDLKVAEDYLKSKRVR